VTRLLLCLAGLMLAEEAADGVGITVRVCDTAHLNGRSLQSAKLEAVRVLASAAIEVKWADCGTQTTRNRPGPRDFVLVICLHGFLKPHTSDDDRVMGLTDLNESGEPSSIYVFYGDVLNFAKDKSAEGETDSILGHVIAHEFGHIFLGPEHSDRGIMQAKWGQDARVLMGKRLLNFNKSQRARAQAAVAARSQGQGLLVQASRQENAGREALPSERAVNAKSSNPVMLPN